jgi:hypothetical protein
LGSYGHHIAAVIALVCLVVIYIIHRRNGGYNDHSVILGPSIEDSRRGARDSDEQVPGLRQAGARSGRRD